MVVLSVLIFYEELTARDKAVMYSMREFILFVEWIIRFRNVAIVCLIYINLPHSGYQLKALLGFSSLEARF